MSPPQPLGASVAICTWNRCDLLRQTLAHFLDLAIPPGLGWELLVIDNHSQDATPAVVRSFAGRLPIRDVYEPVPGLSAARNRALREARGEWVLFTDDDVLVDVEWLAACIETAGRYPSAAVIGGPVEPWFPMAPDAELARAFPALGGGFCGIDHGDIEGPLASDRDLYGANMAFRAAAVAGLQFNPSFGPTAGHAINGDDVEFIARVRRRGGLVVWSPRMRVRHYVDPSRMTLRYLKRYYTDHARMQVRLHGLPASRRLAGIPLWLWRQATVSFFNAYGLRLTGRRSRALEALRRHLYFRGMFLEAWAARRRAAVSQE
jgi:glycosyltransferase involved in cell wall biosynthesis